MIVVGKAANGAAFDTASSAARPYRDCPLLSDDLYAEQSAVWNLKRAPVIGSKITLTTADMIKFWARKFLGRKSMNYKLVVTATALAVSMAFGMVSANAADIISEWHSVKAPPPPPVKPVTVDTKNTALLMLDFLPGGYCGKRPRCIAILPGLKKLLAEARAHHVLVVYSTAGKYKTSDILKPIAPTGNEPSVHAHADKFVHTDLEKILKDHDIHTVIVTGVAANGAVLYTGSGAALRGMNAIIPVDGMAASPYAEQLTVWQLAHGPGFGKRVTITRTDLVKF